MQEAWPSLVRIVVGLFWLYFASQKWQGVGWMKHLIESTARANPIPGLHEFLVSIVVPNWFLFALAQAVNVIESGWVGGGEGWYWFVLVPVLVPALLAPAVKRFPLVALTTAFAGSTTSR